MDNFNNRHSGRPERLRGEQYSCEQNQITLDTSELSSGIYLVRVNINSNIDLIGKLMIGN